MSYRQSLWILYPVSIPTYLAVLENDFGAKVHPGELGAYLIGAPPLPFYAPQLIEDNVVITGFNRIPLSSLLIDALTKHPELAPLSARVRWTEEQDLIASGTLEQLGRKLRSKER